MKSKPSLLIIGGGIIGVTVAREAAISTKFSSITIVDKEPFLGSHASSRNSGVIHAGFYYDPNSERAKFCSKGNALMRDYCLKYSLPLRKCGKVVVSKTHEEEAVLEELKRRGDLNGCNIQLLSKDRLNKYEPLASTYANFLWSPNTWSASPRDVMTKLLSELKQLSVTIRSDLKFESAENNFANFQSGDKLAYDLLINAAGGHALDISRKLGLSSEYSLLPFKGLYLKSRTPDNNFSTHIYPVPRIDQPFLGIHTTLTFDGYLKLGPTAIPVLSPENYTLFEGLNLLKVPSLLLLEATLFLKNSFGFRDAAIKEFKYYIKRNIVNAGQSLTTSRLHEDQFEWYSPGIRAQLYDHKSNSLATDFVMIQDSNNFHILNSISPAWTCSFQTAKHVLSRILNYLE
jgi:L-2-hydroxyglutarate oxidase